MSRTTGTLDLTLNHREPQQSLATWLYAALRGAILDGRLAPGSRLPASRDFARLHGVSRGTVVSVFARLRAEGYVAPRVGSGTWVSQRVIADNRSRTSPSSPPAFVRRVVASYARPKAFVGLLTADRARPFEMRNPDVDQFPARLWGQLVARRARDFGSWARSTEDGRGYQPLREAIAHYLGASRGVRCDRDQIVLVSGVQQALDLLARILLRPGDAVWMEDPGYFGASIAFGGVGARIVPVPVDAQGLSVDAGVKLSPHAKGVYLTPGHQFPLGMTMSLERRMAVLAWARRAGTFIIEDDYDSEYRFTGQPVPALQSLDTAGNVIVIGSFSKLLFPSLRLGYVVLPAPLADYFVAYRRRTDFRSLGLDQVVLCDFIVGGHLGRHLRRMRDLYASRLAALIESGRQYLDGMLAISDVRAGLYTVGFLQNGMTSREAESAAAAQGIEARGLDRFTAKRADPRGVLLGFGAFGEDAIRSGVATLAKALEGRTSRR